jgi:hypothetical protein
MALIVNLPENMKSRTPSWGKQRELISGLKEFFKGKRSCQRIAHKITFTIPLKGDITQYPNKCNKTEEKTQDS